MNRKLIRTTLAEVKEREQQLHQAAQQAAQARQAAAQQAAAQQAIAQQQAAAAQSQQSQQVQQVQPKKKIPPEQTNAETFYYKKQMDAKTSMVIVLQDGEELLGTIEWYDKGSIKLHRQSGPNLLILKHNIKYMYKDQAGGDSSD